MNDNIKAGADIMAGDGGYSIGNQEDHDAFVKVRNQSLAKARIKELAKQATTTEVIHGRGFDTTQYTNHFDKEKFAELIVRECAGVCEEYRGTEWGKAAECIGDSIKEHFGVEE